MSLTDKIQNFRTWQKEHLGYFGKDVKEVGKDFKDKGIYTLLSAGMAMPLVNIGCEVKDPIIPTNEAYLAVTNYTIEKNSDEILPGSELSIYDASDILSKRVADNGAEDLDATRGIIKVKLTPGTYKLDSFAPGTHADMAVFEDSSNNYVAHVDDNLLEKRHGSITLSDEQTKTLNCYMMRDDFDKELYRRIFQHANSTNLQRFPNGTLNLVQSVDPADNFWDGTVPQETYDRINDGVAKLRNATCGKYNINVTNGNDFNGRGWLVHIGNPELPWNSNDQHMNGDIVLNSEVGLKYNTDMHDILAELVPGLGAGLDAEDGSLVVMTDGGNDLNDFGYRSVKLASRSPIGSKY
ncbi:MAG: hypothetical protein PHT54_01135 [Candidatus Nanoarchaeia archaeon]|nr:hypothetical protein [Candidatus Nanoarchaeia archaeon]